MRRVLHLAAAAILLSASAWAQSPSRKIGELELQLLGIQASVDPTNPTVPKNIASGVRVVVTAGGRTLDVSEVARFLGTAAFLAEAELSGPGLRDTITIPQRAPEDPLPADPLLLPLPPLNVSGDYTITNVRLVTGSKSLLDAQPPRVPLKVIDQILVTSVKTRPLTLDEMRDKGIVLDSDDYLGFDFSLGLKLESTVVNLSFPVVFDRQGVVVPQPPAAPPVDASRDSAKAPPTVPESVSILPIMLTAIPESESAGQSNAPITFWEGQPIRIPSVLVIPGNVGYLKQFFSAQLFVANGAPIGAPLTLRDVTGTIKLPLGADLQRGGDNVPNSDDPLVLATTVKGAQPETLPVRGVGPDGEAGTSDDVASFAPAEQGVAEFLLRGDKEGFHTIDLDIKATLDGLPVGPVKIGGKAAGGVLVRNPYFDVSFSVPSTVRRNEKFKVFMTVSNVGQGAANDLTVTLDQLALAGAALLSEGVVNVPVIKPGEARVVTFEFRSNTTGAVVASYLGFHGDSSSSVSGSLKFKLGVGERGVPLSPDTLALPASVESLPPALVDAAMRVLGQGWSLAGAPPGSLAAGVTRISRAVVQQRALALAEAGLRMSLGEPLHSAVSDLTADFFSPRELDPGFDQLLRQTEAGRDLARAMGDALAVAAGSPLGALAEEEALASLLASGPDFISFAASAGSSVDVTVTDGLGRRLVANRSADAIGTSAIPGGAFVPLGAATEAPFLGVLAQPAASPYAVEMSGGAELSFTLPRGDGSFVRAEITSPYRARVIVDLTRPDSLRLEEDQDGDGSFEASQQIPTVELAIPGPALLSASVIGPDSFAGTSPFGTNFALLFDRPVDLAQAAQQSNYQIPDNQVLAVKGQLTGRLVFGTLAFPEGPHVPTTLAVSGIADQRSRLGAPATLPLVARFDPENTIGGVVIGRVVNSDGTPVNGGTVYYTNSSDAQCDLGAAPTTVSAIPLDEEAAYQIRYVTQNKCSLPFEVTYQDPNTGSPRKVSGIVRYDGERIVMDMALVGRGSVAGVVRDLAGHPSPGATVAVVSETDSLTNKQVVADGDGRYLAADVAVGPVAVKAAKGLGLGFSAGRIERSGTTATVDVTLDTGAAARVTGRVYRIDGGQIFPVVAELLAYVVQGAVVGYTYTDLDGRFAFENMPAGAFRIGGRSGFANGTPGQTEVNIVVLTRPAAEFGTVRGTVVLPDGSPAKRVIVAKDVSSFIIDGGVVVDALGRFEMTGLPVGQNGSLQAITADRKRTGSASFQIDPVTRLAEGVVIQLSGIGNAEFTVKDANGNPVPNVEVTLVNAGGPLTLGACAHPCGCNAKLTGLDGKVFYEDQPLGRVTAQAIRRGAGFIDVAQATASITQDGSTGVAALRFPGTGTVSGLVRYPEGTFGGGGEIALSSNVFRNDGRYFCGLKGGEVSHRALIDPATGRFRFTGVNIGPVFVTATNGFFPTPVGASGTLTGNGQELELELRFVNTIAGELTGTVFLPDGAIPAGSGVEVTADGAALQKVTVRTDALGNYKFAAVLPAGGYTITARDSATGSVARGNVYMAASRAAQLDLRLKSRGIVRVRVVDGADQPVPKAFVKLTETEFPNKTYEAAIEPANQGVAVFERVFEGPFSVEAKGQTTGGRVSSILPRAAGSSVDVKVRLGVTGTVKGHFHYPNGMPVPFGLVTLKAGGRTLGQMTTPGSGPDVGAFSFDSVPAGAFRLEAQDPLTTRTGFAVGTIVGQDQEVALNVIAQGLGTVQGVVTSNGQPWTTGARAVVVSGSFRATTFADGTGHYLIEGVPEGRVEVTASPSDGFLTGTASATLTGDGTALTIDVALRDSGTLKGRVVMADGETQGPPSIVSISVSGSGGGNQSVATGADGRFQFDRVPSGRVTLSVDVVGSIDQARAAIELPPGETLDVTVPLNGIGAIHGLAKGSDGTPIAGQVQVLGTGTFPWGQTIAVTSSGEWSVHEALAGPFTVSLRASEGTFTLHGTASGTVTPGETTDFLVQVQDSGTVKGRVLRADGTTPATGAEVTLELSAGRGSFVFYAASDGGFEADGVPVGLFTLRVFDPVTTGRVALAGSAVRDNGDSVDVGTLLLDESGPTLQFLEPQAGVTRARFGGPVVLELGNVADLDPNSIGIVYPNGAFLGGLVVSGSRATGQLSVPNLKVGTNVLRARALDRTGNLGEAEVRITLTGGTVRGRVTTADGAVAGNVPVRIGLLEEMRTAVDGTWNRPGMAPGAYTVTASDPATLLTASASGTLFDGESEVATIDVQLPAFGSIVGVVRHPSGAPASFVKVQLDSAFGPQMTTLAGGAFHFERVLLGLHTVYATDEAHGGDRGSVTAVVSAHGQETSADIFLNGVGSAQVRVLTAAGVPVAGASVLLSSSAGASYTGSTPTTGLAQFSDVLAGTLTARATDPRGLVAEALSTLADGGLADITITLPAAGRIEGRVMRFDGVAAGADVVVTLSGSRSATVVTNAAGQFAFSDVPVGGFSLSALVPSTGDRGSAAGTLSSDGQALGVDIPLIGTGTVRVTVRDSNGGLVSGARVDVSGSQVTRTAMTDAGVAVVPNILAGPFSVTASSGALRGSAAGTLAAGALVDVDVALEAVATVRGRVFEPDGVTPASAILVGIGVGNPGTFMTTGSDGLFEFTNLRLTSYVLTADRNARRRALAFVASSSNGQILEQDLVLIGVGTVTGILRNASGAPIPGHSVSLTISAGAFGGFRSLNTDFDGRFTFTDVPISTFALVVTRGADRADASGAITSDGQTATHNLQLLASAVTLPYGLTDANFNGLSFQADGRFATGDACVNFAGGHKLTLVRDGVAESFAGSGSTIPTEENKRELVFTQAGLQGLTVTRKAFVPRDGYFLRDLDLLRNDGAEPVTVDVAFLTETDFRWNPALVSSSSGDAVLDAGDRWVVYDDVDGGTCSFPHTALSFLGAGGAPPAQASFTKQSTVARLETRWDAITVMPGQSVGFLHVQTRQTSLARAQASVERLGGLPPELLVGLTPEEAQAVVNFVVPADLVSTLPALPLLDGEVVGRVLSGDNTTLVPGASVTFESRSPHYNRALSVTSAADGTFRVLADLVSSPPRVIPREAFDLLASAASPAGTRMTSATGGFAPAAQRADQDIVFTGMGAVEGRVRRSDGSVLTNAFVRIDGSSGGQIATSTIGSTPEQFRFPVVPPGTYTLTGTHPLGGNVSVSTGVTVMANQKTLQDLGFPAFGSLTGSVRTAAGIPMIGSLITLSGPNGFSRGASSQSTYTFADLPPGTYTVTARDERNFASVSQSVTVEAGAPTALDLFHAPVGQIQVTATVGGAPLQGAIPRWQSDARGPDFVGGCTTDALGRCTLTSVSGPSVRVRVEYPGVPQSFGEGTVALTMEGQTVAAEIAVPGVGTVTGYLRTRDGGVFPSPSSGAVSLYHATEPTQIKGWAVTDASGRFTFTNVPIGAFRVRVSRDASPSYSQGESPGVLTHGQTLELDVVEPRGILSDASQVDLWQATFAVGQTVNIRVDGQALGVAGLLADPSLDVYGPDGSLVVTREDTTPGIAFAAVDFMASQAGRHVIAVRTRSAGGAYRLGSNYANDAHVFRVYGGPMLSGRVTREGDGAAVAGQRLRLTLPSAGTAEAYTGSDGRYSVPVFVSGAITLDALDAEGIVAATAAGTIPEPLVAASLDLVVPARGTVDVSVRKAGQPVSGASVQIASDHATALVADKSRSRTTSAAGTVTASLPVGNVTASTLDLLRGVTASATGVLEPGATLDLTLALAAPTTFRGTVRATDATPLAGASVTLSNGASATTSASGQFAIAGAAPGGHTLTATYQGATASQPVTAPFDGGDVVVDFSLVASTLTQLAGTIFTGDGVTPLPFATVSLTASGTNRGTTSDAAGRYTMADVEAGMYTLAASFAGRSISRSVSLSGGDVTQNMNVPLPVVRGTVSEPNGAPVADATVTLCPFFYPCASATTDSEGRYIFYGLPNGVSGAFIELRAMPGDGSDLLAFTSFNYFAGFTGTLVKNLVLPASAALAGVVRDAGGAPVANALVQVFEESSGQMLRSASTAADGSYSIAHLQPGAVRVYPRDAEEIPGIALATLVLGQTVVADISLVATATLEVTASTSISPVELQAPEAPRPFSWSPPWSRNICFGDGDCVQPLTQTFVVPAGLVRALYQGSPPTAGEAVLAAGGNASVSLAPGSHIFRSQGPTGQFVKPSVGGVESFLEIVKPELGGRSLRSLTATGEGLRVKRLEFAPASGAFTRTLTLVSNPGADPVAVDVQAGLSLGDPEWALHTTSSGDNVLDLTDNYAVTVRSAVLEVDGQPLGGDPEATGRAIVFGSALAATAASFWGGSVEVDPDGFAQVSQGSLGVAHSLTILPGETRALLAFAVYAADATEALACAQALAALSDPLALAGLSDAERAAIVNFVVPEPTRIAGVVRSAAGDAVSGARVMAIQAGAISLETSSDEAGAYRLDVAAGTHTVVAIDLSNNRPGRTDLTIGAGTVVFADVTLLADHDLGAVRVTGVPPEAFADSDVVVESAAFAPAWSASARLSAAAEALVLGVPAGPASVRSLTRPDVSAQGDVPAQGTLDVTLTLLATSEIRGVVVDFASIPVAGARVALYSASLRPVRQTTADADGRFAITGLVAGGYDIRAWDPVSRQVAQVFSFVPEAGAIDVALRLASWPAKGTVRVRATFEATRAPAAGVTVKLEPQDFAGLWVEERTLDANGEGVFTDVPADAYVRVFTGAPPTGDDEAAFLPAGTEVEVVLGIGELRAFPIELTGLDGVRYVAWPESGVEANALAQWTCVPFCSGNAGYDDGVYGFGFVERSSGRYRETAEGRELEVGLWSHVGLRGVRKTFVPAAGRFVRLIDILENATDAPLSINYYTSTYAAPTDGRTWTVRATSNGDLTFDVADFFVAFSASDAAAPELAWVVAGPGATVSRSYSSATADAYAYADDAGSLTLLPGQKAVLMRFAVQRPHGQAQAALDQAAALVDLTDPDALKGLTPDERLLVVNFVVLQP